MNQVPEEKYQISVYWAQLMYDLLVHEGLEANALFRSCGLEIAQLTNSTAYFDADNLTRLWKMVVEITGDEYFGLKMGRIAPINPFGIYSSAFLSNSSFSDAISNAIKYQSTLGTGLCLQQAADPTQLKVVIEAFGNDLPPSREGYDATLSLIAASLQSICKPPIQTKAIEFAYEQPNDLTPYRQIFTDPIYFGRDHFSITFDPNTINHSLIFADKELHQYHKNNLEKATALTRVTTLSEQVSQLIHKRLDKGEPTVGEIAKELNVSVRTLQRNLAQEGPNFRQLLEEVRINLVKDYLESPFVNLQELHFLLGYSDQSNFYRAFRRWFGKTPGEFREEIKQDKPFL